MLVIWVESCGWISDGEYKGKYLWKCVRDRRGSYSFFVPLLNSEMMNYKDIKMEDIFKLTHLLSSCKEECLCFVIYQKKTGNYHSNFQAQKFLLNPNKSGKFETKYWKLYYFVPISKVFIIIITLYYIYYIMYLYKILYINYIFIYIFIYVCYVIHLYSIYYIIKFML